MAKSISSSGTQSDIKSLTGFSYILPLRFTTDAGGTPTLSNDHNGSVTCTEATDVYTLTVPVFGECMAVVIDCSDKAINIVRTSITASTGVFVFTAGATLVSDSVDILLFLKDSRT